MQRVEVGLKPLPIFWYRHFARQKPQLKGLNKDYFDESVVKWTWSPYAPSRVSNMYEHLSDHGKTVNLAAQAPKRSRL